MRGIAAVCSLAAFTFVALLTVYIALEIQTKADREVTVLIAQATAAGEQARGDGDAARNRIYAASAIPSFSPSIDRCTLTKMPCRPSARACC